MPLPNHCIDCDKVATVLDGSTPYCSRCYKREILDVKRKSSKKTFKTMRKRL
jgi:hypothetical protein